MKARGYSFALFGVLAMLGASLAGVVSAGLLLGTGVPSTHLEGGLGEQSNMSVSGGTSKTSASIASSGCNPAMSSALFSCLQNELSGSSGSSFLTNDAFLGIVIQGSETIGQEYGFPWEYIFAQMQGVECSQCQYAQFPGPGAGDVNSGQNCFNWWSSTPGGPGGYSQSNYWAPPNGVEAESISGYGWRCYNPSDRAYDMTDFNVAPGGVGTNPDSEAQALDSLQAATTGPVGLTHYISQNLGAIYENQWHGSSIQNTCNIATWSGGTFAMFRPGSTEAAYASDIESAVTSIFGSVAAVQSAATVGANGGCTTPSAVTAGGTGISYNRAAVVSFAQHYYNQVVPDGYFYADSETFSANNNGAPNAISGAGASQCVWDSQAWESSNGGYNYECQWGPDQPLSSFGNPAGTALNHGVDCAHFVSAAIGTDFGDGFSGGGLYLGSDFAGTSHIYGVLNVPDLVTQLENKDDGVNEGTNWAQVQLGDMLVFGNGDHIEIIVGTTAADGTFSPTTALLASHTASAWDQPAIDAINGFGGVYYVLHIKSSDPTPSGTTFKVSPAIPTVGIEVNGRAVANGQVIAYPDNTILSVTPVLPKGVGYVFGSWTVMGGLSLWYPSASSKVLVSSLIGTLTLNLLKIGCPENPKINGCISGTARDGAGPGYWMVGTDGGIFTEAGAKYYGSMGGKYLNAPIVGMAANPTGTGYWMVGADGGVFSFGAVKFYGSMGGQRLNAPIVGITSTPDGRGYWLVAADGGIFAFGDAHFYGSMGGHHLNMPIVGMAATSDGHGYWLVAEDGGIFTFGDAHYYGSVPGLHISLKAGHYVIGMAAGPNNVGYTLAAQDAGVFAFSTKFYGAGGSTDVVALWASPTDSGYVLVTAGGTVLAFPSGFTA